MPCDSCGYSKTVANIEREIDGKNVCVELCERCLLEGSPRNDNWLRDILARKERGDTKARSDVCPNCEMTEDEIGSENRPGCGTCYEFFKSVIEKLVGESQQGEKKHKGKKPGQSV